MTTDAGDRETLLNIARDAIVAHVTGVRADVGAGGNLAQRRGGVFVTVYCSGELRGCIGQLRDDKPLVQAVAECARSAASADPRFPPIAATELQSVDVELSLLGPFESIQEPAEIVVGRHGVLVEQRGLRGLLLPQVATEWEWDAETFLARTCQKAGLPLDAWKKGATLWRFDAEVFR
jgi:AmmeMemoRadiSam system protein A